MFITNTALPWPISSIVQYILGQYVFYPMVRLGFLKLNELAIDDMYNEKQINYLKQFSKMKELEKDASKDKVKQTALDLANAILDFNSIRKPDGLLKAN